MKQQVLVGAFAMLVGTMLSTNALAAPGKDGDQGPVKTVKGQHDIEGEIIGNPIPGSKFSKLEIGMSQTQVNDMIGSAKECGSYMTGKAWIPFYFGSYRHRFEMLYKGQGRLIFAGGSLGDYAGGNLIWIIHNASEPGYR